MARACGIDFGTSNSTVGWLRPNAPILLPLEDGKVTLPSVVFFNAEENSSHFGRDALNEYLTGYEGRLMRSLKSILGTSLIDGQTEVMGRALRFRDLLSYFIGELKVRGEAAAQHEFRQVVMGRPVHFVDDDQEADQRAEDTLADIAKSCGFEEVSFQFEPIAAAFDYEQQISSEELVLIVDIGGGTSDFSLVRLSPDRRQLVDRKDDILGNAGVHIGGTDFDRRLSLETVMPLLGYRTGLKHRNAEIPSSYYFNLATWHTINLAYTRKVWAELQDVMRDVAEPVKFKRLLTLIDDKAGHELAMRVEAAKITLSSELQTEIDLDIAEVDLSHEISQADFFQAIDPEVNRVAATVDGMLKTAGLNAAHIDTVFFTGGSSGIPHLRAKIASVLPAARHVEGDLFGSIGAGLAIDAARRYG
ncbi:Hsp70 family protein [Leeia sp. TBRC 13508]|uniref:Hsp70 family protein n=1 Tax=Leeia speluncae TaxID=2884804 RepID=A0ABS8D4W2_9NEIS|nr:Hsp70 family protein [Leeia speluncae]MCB6183216.1 Hsp70 family protein [Leeia speluncae]